MQSQLWHHHISNSLLLSLFLNVLVCLFHDVNGNSQILVTTFPTGTTNPAHPNELSVQLRMLGGNPTESNQRVCTGFTLTPGDQFWIKQVKGVVTRSNIGMNLYGCNYVPINPCSCSLADMTLIGSWGRYTPPTRFNSTLNTIGFNVGGDSEVKLLLLEITYATTIPSPDFSNGFDIQITRDKPLYYAAMYTAMAFGTIPGGSSAYTLDACITIPSTQPNPIKTLAFRPSTASYGRLVSTYIKSSTTGVITELGRANPQFPAAFYVTPISYTLNAGDTIMHRCVFNTTGLTSSLITNGFNRPYNETCMMTILWLTANSSPLKSTNSFLKGNCTSDQSASFPSSSTTLLPNNTILDLAALYGNQSGIVTIDSTHSVNLDLETFKDLYP